MCGTPSEATWPGVTQLKLWGEFGPQQPQPRRVSEYLIKETNNQYPKSLYDLIDKLLVLNPDHRLTVHQALNHEFFAQDPAPEKPEQSQIMKKQKKVSLDGKELGENRNETKTTDNINDNTPSSSSTDCHEFIIR